MKKVCDLQSNRKIIKPDWNPKAAVLILGVLNLCVSQILLMMIMVEMISSR